MFCPAALFPSRNRHSSSLVASLSSSNTAFCRSRSVFVAVSSESRSALAVSSCEGSSSLSCIFLLFGFFSASVAVDAEGAVGVVACSVSSSSSTAGLFGLYCGLQLADLRFGRLSCSTTTPSISLDNRSCRAAGPSPPTSGTRSFGLWEWSHLSSFLHPLFAQKKAHATVFLSFGCWISRACSSGRSCCLC